jgi:hypothetical protein
VIANGIFSFSEAIEKMKTIKKIHENANEFDTLVRMSGMKTSELLQLFGITQIKLARWRSGHSKIPLPAMRLARARLGGQLAEVMGKAWADFHLNPCTQALTLPGMKYPMTFPDLRATWVEIHNAVSNTSKLEFTYAELTHANKRADYYRNLLYQESSKNHYKHAANLLSMLKL